ncbi:MAG: peptidylprolyl isomerase [Flavobacteriaceae bacterium]
MSCQDKQTQKNTTTTVPATPVKKVVPNRVIEDQPLITQTNVIDYLTTYGQKHQEENAIISTRFGDIHIQLFNDTPLHRANFILLVKEGYFNTTCFHRVVEDFIIQAGQSDKNSTRVLRQKIGNYKIPPEFRNYQHHKGALSSARRWNQNPKKLSDAYEFFIVHKNKGLHHLNNEHTVFGRVTKGLEVVDQIAQVAIDKGEWPLNNVNLSVTVH